MKKYFGVRVALALTNTAEFLLNVADTALANTVSKAQTKIDTKADKAKLAAFNARARAQAIEQKAEVTKAQSADALKTLVDKAGRPYLLSE